MSSFRFELENKLSPTASDDVIANLGALAVTENEPEVYRLGIDHDVRAAACRKGGPKTGACPVSYDWAHRDLVGIETRYKHVAVHWALTALHHGYTVRITDKNNVDAIPGYNVSIEKCRRRAEYAARPRPTLDDDEDIPF
jgi:hypothetical protein